MPLFTKELIKPEPDETWLLVTSAFHMPRAMGLFRKAGFPVVPWPVDYRTAGNEGIGMLRDNEADALQTTDGALREWIGLIAYWLTGQDRLPSAGTPDDRRQCRRPARTDGGQRRIVQCRAERR